MQGGVQEECGRKRWKGRVIERQRCEGSWHESQENEEKWEVCVCVCV